MAIQPIMRLELRASDVAAVRSIVRRVVQEAPGTPDDGYLRRLAVLGHELPRSIREALVDFRLAGRPAGGFVISGLPVSDGDLGPTPTTTTAAPRNAEIDRADAAMLLMASILGDPFSHAGVRGGRLIIDVAPIPGEETTQLASSSLEELKWHNEDAYFDVRADWLFLMCLRNPSRVPTTFARIRDIHLTDKLRTALFEQRFWMMPDSSHAGHEGTRRVAVLSGSVDAPFVRIDPAFMRSDLSDEVAEQALATVVHAFEANLQEVVLAPGEIMVLDNLRSVHGRRAFQPRFDGTDRWLRLVNITANLRYFDADRASEHGRAVGSRLRAPSELGIGLM